MKTLPSTLGAVLLLAAGGGAMEPTAKTAKQADELMLSSAGVVAAVECVDSERRFMFWGSYYQDCCDRGAWGVRGLGGVITYHCP